MSKHEFSANTTRYVLNPQSREIRINLIGCMRICPKCNELLPLSNFGLRLMEGQPRVLTNQSWCTWCRNDVDNDVEDQHK